MSISLVATKDGTKVDIEKVCLRHSELLNNLVQEYKDDNEISIPELEGSTLKQVCEYLAHYKETDPAHVPKPLEKYDIKEMYGEWEDNYMKPFETDRAMMFKLLEGANYIGCQKLLDLATSKVAIMIKDLSGKEICDYFGLPEDLTEEEKQKMIEDWEREQDEKKDKEMQEERERQAKEKENAESENAEGEDKEVKGDN
jgi:hypothetical protein